MEWLDYSKSLEGWMSEDELQWLYRHALGRQTIVEFGVWKGRSTSAIAAACPGIVYAVDRWEGTGPYQELNDPQGKAKVKAQAAANLSQFSNVRLIDSPTSEALPLLLAADPKLQIDLLFIDANHDYQSVKDDCRWLEKYMAPGSITSGHDYGGEVKRAVDEKYGGRVRCEAGSIWWVQNG